MRIQKTAAIAILTVLLIAGLAWQFSPDAHVVVNDHEIGGLFGFSMLAGGLGIGVLATVFALACTGLVIAGVSALMVVVAGLVVVALAVSLLPLALPFLILAGIVYLIARPSRRTA